MGGPAELADRHDAVEHIATRHQMRGVA
jgi:hypothetical protein